MLFLVETTEKLRILTFCLRDVQFIDCAKDFDWACDRQTVRLCSLTRDNLKQTNKIDNFRRFFFSLIITRAIILKQLFVSGSVNIGEYSTRLIFTNIYNQVSRFRPQPRIPTWSTENWHIAGYLFHFYFSVFRACAVILESKVVGWTASLFWEHLKPPTVELQQWDFVAMANIVTVSLIQYFCIIQWYNTNL